MYQIKLNENTNAFEYKQQINEGLFTTLKTSSEVTTLYFTQQPLNKLSVHALGFGSHVKSITIPAIGGSIARIAVHGFIEKDLTYPIAYYQLSDKGPYETTTMIVQSNQFNKSDYIEGSIIHLDNMYVKTDVDIILKAFNANDQELDIDNRYVVIYDLTFDIYYY